MLEYLVEVWVGGGDQRWSAQTVSVMAQSVEAARREVAERLCLPPEAWQGSNPPLELRVPAAHPVPERYALAWLTRQQARQFERERQAAAQPSLGVV